MNAKILAIFLLIFSSIAYGKNEIIAFLRNGDAIPGTIELLNKGHTLLWDAPFFEENITIPTDDISTIKFPKTSMILPEGKKSYLVTTRHGNVLRGEITEINPELIKISSLRHGQVQLKRSEVSSLQHLHQHWQYSITNKGNWNHSLWDKEDNGQLSTCLRNVKISGSFLLTEKFCINLNLHWKKNPRFAFNLKQEGGAIKPSIGLSLETWEDNLIFLLGSDFKLIRKLSQNEPGKLEVSLYVDPANATAEIVDMNGVSLAKMKGKPGSNLEKFHFAIQNQSEDLKVQKLDVINWLSDSPVNKQNSSGFINSDGKWTSGYLHTFQPNKKDLFIPGAPIIEAETIHFIEFHKQHVPEKGKVSETTLHFNDMTKIGGKLTKLDDTIAYVKIPASKEPIPCKLNGIQFIKWATPEQKAEEEPDPSDQLHWHSGHLSGSLIPDGNKKFPLTWKPFFESKAVPLSHKVSYSIQRKQVDARALQLDKHKAIVHFRNKMEIPASISDFTDNTLTIQSPILSDPKVFPTTQLRAVRFPIEVELSNIPGSINWSIDPKYSDNYQIKDGKLHITGRVEIQGPPTKESEISLTIEEIKNATFTFGISNHKEGEKVTPERTRSRIYIEKRRNYCSMTKRKKNGTSSSGFSIRENKMKLGLKFENTLNLSFNNIHESLPLEDISHTILYIIPKEGTVIIHSPQMVQTIRSIQSPSELGKTLSLPRLAAKSPPPNILVAPNGDTLRGELQSIQSEKLVFRSMKRTLKIPISRCSTILWMPPEGIPPPPIISQGNVRFTLANGTVIPMELNAYADGELRGESNDIGECVVPFHSIKELHFWQSGYLEPLDTFDHWQYTINQPKPLEN